MMSWLRSITASRAVAEIDMSTPQGRSRERLRRIGLTSGASIAARGIAFATAFITIPLTLRYLGAERYGMWSTLTSIIALASFADLGLGNGLLNTLARAHGLDDRSAAQRQVSSAFVVLATIATALALAFALAYGRVDWARLFNVSSPQARSEAGPATAVFVACFLVNLPIAVVTRIRQAYQEGYKTSFFEAGGNLLSLGIVVAAIHAQAPVVVLVAAMAGIPTLATLVNAIVLFVKDRRWLRVSASSYDGPTARRLLVSGLLFFALQLAGALYYAPDNLIVAQLHGPEAVARYAVVAKLFSVSVLLSEVSLAPIWPAYREAMARGDSMWVRQALLHSIGIAVVGSLLFATVLVGFGNLVIAAWVGRDMFASLGVLTGLGLWTVLGTVGTAVAMYLNAANLISVQVACAAVMVPASLALKVVLVDRWGLAGLPWGLTIAYVAFVAIPLAVLAKRGRLRPG
jgi:O-antigen/teichoic acid export membrane protein